MGRTLQEDMASDDENCVLETESGFAETVTYVPKGGPSRQVVMVIDRRSDFRSNEQGLSDIEIAECFCLRNAASVAKGGINAPQIGDGILLSATVDPTQRPFAYTGVATDVTHSSWVLHFSRDVIYRQGGSEQTGSTR